MNEKEFATVFHLLYLIVITVLGVLFAVMTKLSHWEPWAPTLITMAIMLVWIIHLADYGTASGRQLFYTVLVDIALLYYARNTVAFFDLPIVLCIFIMVVSIGNDDRLMFLLMAVYGIAFIYHSTFTGLIWVGMPGLQISRLALGMVSITCAIIVSRFFVQKQMNDSLERKRLEELLELSHAENEKFMANISHELRTPINAVNGISQVLLQREDCALFREDIENINSAGKRLSRQISDVLDYSEIATGELVLTERDYEITSIINDVLSNLKWKDDVEYAVDIQADVPIVLHGDAEKLRKIVSILLQNSIKYTEHGGVFMKIGKTDEDYGINLTIDMRDTGVGMTQDEVANIYKSFESMRPLRMSEYSGLGIGLIVAYGFIKLMGGNIRVTSYKDRSTNIRVSVPQKIVNPKRTMSIVHPEKYSLVCYFNEEIRVNAHIGEVYHDILQGLRDTFGIKIDSYLSLDQMKESIEKKLPSHVLLTEWEYEMDREYFGRLANEAFIVVFTSKAFEESANKNVIFLKPPVYNLSIVDLLNETIPGTERRHKEEKKLSFKGARALVVDDDNMNLAVAKGILKNYGMDVRVASSGMEAIDICKIDSFDIIFMDHMMPVMDGVECMKNLRLIRKHGMDTVPIVALSANAVSGARDMFINEGFDDFLSKPIEIAVLERILKKNIRGGVINA